MIPVLTPEQMREADRITIERGTPGEVLMENAGRRVVEVIEREHVPLLLQRVVIFCGKGNNGGDGRVVARLLQDRVAAMQVVAMTESPEVQIDQPTLIVDAILGTGLKGPASGAALACIRAINAIRGARVIAVDVPSGLGGGGEFVRADITVTFAAPKIEHFLPEGAADAVGRLIVADIGIAPDVLHSDVELSEAHDFAPLLGPRKLETHKGDFGHVLVIGGAPGKTGAAAMSGLAALRDGRRIGHGRMLGFVAFSAGTDVGTARRFLTRKDHRGRRGTGVGPESRHCWDACSKKFACRWSSTRTA